MSLKFKILGLGLLAVMATSAFAAVNASALTTGHFTAEPAVGDHHVIVKGTDAYKTAHQLVFKEVGAAEGISCTDSEYHGTLSGAAATTTQAIQVRPTYKNCATESGAWGSVAVHVPAACGTNVFEFTSRSAGHATVHVRCAIQVTHPNCTINIPAQTPHSGGVTYTTTTEINKHAITLNSTVGGITANYEGGICIFLGTSHTYEMTGSATVWGEDTATNRVGITAT